MLALRTRRRTSPRLDRSSKMITRMTRCRRARCGCCPSRPRGTESRTLFRRGAARGRPSPRCCRREAGERGRVEVAVSPLLASSCPFLSTRKTALAAASRWSWSQIAVICLNSSSNKTIGVELIGQEPRAGAGSGGEKEVGSVRRDPPTPGRERNIGPGNRQELRRCASHLAPAGVSARPRVTWSAYSRSVPTETPLAMRVIRTPRGRIRRWM
jgi:hypothetical protein